MMKTKLIFLTWLLLLPIAMIASSGEVVLQCGNIGGGWNGGNGGGAPIPRVTYDDTSITFSCDSTISQVDVVVKDIQGNVLIEDTISLNHTYVLYHAPESLNHQRYLVELYFDNRYYYGYLDQ
jgi:hypothetical protein